MKRDEKGRFTKGQHPDTEFEKGHTPWNKGKNMVGVDISPSEDLAYIVGVFYGDANLRKRGIELKVADKEFAEAFKNALENIGLNPSIGKMKDGRFRVIGYSKTLNSWFSENSLKECWEYISDFDGAFIRGIYDSEGTLSRVPNRYTYRLEISNTNMGLLEIVAKILNDWGFNTEIRRIHDDVYSIKLLPGSFIHINEAINQFLKKVKPNIPKKSIQLEVPRKYRIRKHRDKIANLYSRGFTQEEIAKRFDISQSLVSKYVRGEAT